MGTYRVDEEPVKFNNILAEEERGTGLGLCQEISSKECDPSKQVESSIRLEDEECDSLLQE